MSLDQKKLYDMGVFMSVAGSHFCKFPYDIVQIITFMIYSDIVN